MSTLPTLALLTLLGGVPAATPDDDWPFAAEMPALGLDLYNLGLIGAKCSDEDRPPVRERASSGKVAVEVDPDDRASRSGPARLVVELLLPGGPAELAGLEVGDVIVAVGGADFSKRGSFEPLSEALVKAASGSKKGELVLRVERPGEPGFQQLTLAIAQLGKAAAKPGSEAGRRA